MDYQTNKYAKLLLQSVCLGIHFHQRPHINFKSGSVFPQNSLLNADRNAFSLSRAQLEK